MTENFPDSELVAMTLDGDERAFEVLVRRYRRVALARAVALVSDPAEAEDVVQEAFIRAHDGLSLLRDPARLGPWLMATVRNLALNAERTRKRRRIDAVDYRNVPDDRMLSDRTTLGGDLQAELLRALLQLPTVQREVVLLSDLEGCAHAEIARLLGISVLMSRRHLSDARKRLRELLTIQGP